jgi:hypothetical protein
VLRRVAHRLLLFSLFSAVFLFGIIGQARADYVVACPAVECPGSASLQESSAWEDSSGWSNADSSAGISLSSSEQGDPLDAGDSPFDWLVAATFSSRLASWAGGRPVPTRVKNRSPKSNLAPSPQQTTYPTDLPSRVGGEIVRRRPILMKDQLLRPP